MKYLLIVVIFFSCNTNPNKNSAAKIPAETLDTIKSSAVRSSAIPLIFESAFQPGTTHRMDNSTIHFTGITIGQIGITSGQIIACDPMHIDEYGKPFTAIFPTGDFPVQLSIIRLEGEASIAFARIYFSDQPVEKWEFALLKGQAPLPLGEKKMHGYSVDAGVGLFIDQAASEVLDKDAVTRMDRGIYKEMEKHIHNGWRYAIYNFGKHNLAAFSTGLGDGYYATYIGRDINGKPCRLLTDFGVFDWKTRRD